MDLSLLFLIISRYLKDIMAPLQEYFEHKGTDKAPKVCVLCVVFVLCIVLGIRVLYCLYSVVCHVWVMRVWLCENVYIYIPYTKYLFSPPPPPVRFLIASYQPK